MSRGTAAKSSASFKDLQTSHLPKHFNAMLERLQDIPTLPVVATQINNLINDPNSSAADIAAVMKKDQVLTAKILKLINSPYYGIPGGVTDVQRALAFLGFNTVAQLVLGISVFSLFPDDGKKEDFQIFQFWRHALATAVCSEIIAREIKYAKPEEAFTCGLLHDIGKLVLHQIAHDTLNEVVMRAKAEKKSFFEVECELDLPTHGFLGEAIAAKWALPQVLRNAIRYHHTDVRNVSTLLPSAKIPAQIVGLADALVVAQAIGHSGNYTDGQLQPWMHECLGLDAVQTKAIRERVSTEMGKVGSFLSG